MLVDETLDAIWARGQAQAQVQIAATTLCSSCADDASWGRKPFATAARTLRSVSAAGHSGKASSKARLTSASLNVSTLQPSGPAYSVYK